MKVYQAYAKGCTCTAETPQKAAEMFFNTFPNKRKCNIIQGKIEGDSFVVHYGISTMGEWPESFKDVTKKQVSSLPN